MAIIIAGQNFVLTQDGFEISGNANVIISTTPCQADKAIIHKNLELINEPDELPIKDIKTVKNEQ